MPITFFISIKINQIYAKLYFTQDIRDSIHKLTVIEYDNMMFDEFDINDSDILCYSSDNLSNKVIMFNISDIDDKVITTVKIKSNYEKVS